MKVVIDTNVLVSAALKDRGPERVIRWVVFLSCALACQADYLITGDGDFTVARRLGNTAIISVSMFERIVCAAF